MSDLHPSILHVGNIAGVSCTLAKWTNKIYDVRTNVYAMKKHDRLGHITYGEPREEIGKRFFSLVLRDVQDFDVIHLHGLDDFVYTIKKYYPEKPVILHYHGTDIRRRWATRRSYWSQANVILVSTRNLLEGAPKDTIHLPNPIDTDLFYLDSDKKPSNRALAFRHGAVDLAERLAKQHGLELDVHSRNKRFVEMPNFLRQYGWYMDVKRGIMGILRRSGSMTGLEALACGLKVINSDGEIREGLPPEHQAENAVKALHPIYEELTV